MVSLGTTSLSPQQFDVEIRQTFLFDAILIGVILSYPVNKQHSNQNCRFVYV